MSRLPTLRAGSDFRRVYRDGGKARRDGVTVFVAPAPGPGTRLGIVVPARVGGAVDRNRIKRRIRSIAAAVELPAGNDVVVRVGPTARDASFQELEKHVNDALTAAGAGR